VCIKTLRIKNTSYTWGSILILQILDIIAFDFLGQDLEPVIILHDEISERHGHGHGAPSATIDCDEAIGVLDTPHRRLAGFTHQDLLLLGLDQVVATLVLERRAISALMAKLPTLKAWPLVRWHEPFWTLILGVSGLAAHRAPQLFWVAT